MAEKSVIDYHDALLYERDVALLSDGQWLNDSCVNFVFRVFEHHMFPHLREVLFLDPSVTSYIKLQFLDNDDIRDLDRGVHFSERRWILVPVNDNNSFGASSSHWSLLVIDYMSRDVYHMDSHAPMNSTAALVTARRMFTVFNWNDPVSVLELTVPQQVNGYDCGIYILLFAEVIAKEFSNNSSVSMETICERVLVDVTAQIATEFRSRIIELIRSGRLQS